MIDIESRRRIPQNATPIHLFDGDAMRTEPLEACAALDKT